MTHIPMPTSRKPPPELRGGQQGAPPAPCNALHQTPLGSCTGQSGPAAGTPCTQPCLQPLPVTAQWWITADREQPSNSPAQHREGPGAPQGKAEVPQVLPQPQHPLGGVHSTQLHPQDATTLPKPPPSQGWWAISGCQPHSIPISKAPRGVPHPTPAPGLTSRGVPAGECCSARPQPPRIPFSPPPPLSLSAACGRSLPSQPSPAGKASPHRGER